MDSLCVSTVTCHTNCVYYYLIFFIIWCLLALSFHSLISPSTSSPTFGKKFILSITMLNFDYCEFWMIHSGCLIFHVWILITMLILISNLEIQDLFVSILLRFWNQLFIYITSFVLQVSLITVRKAGICSTTCVIILEVAPQPISKHGMMQRRRVETWVVILPV